MPGGEAMTVAIYMKELLFPKDVKTCKIWPNF